MSNYNAVFKCSVCGRWHERYDMAVVDDHGWNCCRYCEWCPESTVKQYSRYRIRPGQQAQTNDSLLQWVYCEDDDD